MRNKPPFCPDAHTQDELKEFERSFYYDLKRKYDMLKLIERMDNREFEPLTKPWLYIPAVFVIGFVILFIMSLLV